MNAANLKPPCVRFVALFFFLNKEKYGAKFLDKDGKNLANQEITVIIDGMKQSYVTDNNGEIDFSNLSEGQHTITLINPETGEEITFILDNDLIRENHDINMKYGDHTKFTVKIVNGSEVQRDAEVTFTINGISQTAKTDENGTASIEIKNPPGDYQITTTYMSDSKSNKIHVDK